MPKKNRKSNDIEKCMYCYTEHEVQEFNYYGVTVKLCPYAPDNSFNYLRGVSMEENTKLYNMRVKKVSPSSIYQKGEEILPNGYVTITSDKAEEFFTGNNKVSNGEPSTLSLLTKIQMETDSLLLRIAALEDDLKGLLEKGGKPPVDAVYGNINDPNINTLDSILMFQLAKIRKSTANIKGIRYRLML